jgi:DNA-binding NarL/FixJ family response regulator
LNEERRDVIIRILVVDDFKAWRGFVSSIVQEHSNWELAGEAADGLEAVQKAQELQPDLILLDIGLPKLNGIAAARRIRELSPKSKILFLSQESSADAVQEAFSLGAQGYVVKAYAGSKLVPAMEAVLRGHRFVNEELSVPRFTDPGAHVPDQPRQRQAHSSPPRRNRETTRGHVVQFHSDDASLLDSFARFIEENLKAGNAVIALTTHAHRNSLLQRLQELGVDYASAIEQGRYLPVDVAETFSTFMVNGLPDPSRFSKAARQLIASIAKTGTNEPLRVATCGEGTQALCAQGKADAAIQVEHLWDEMAEKYDLDVLCGYLSNGFQSEQESDVYKRICAEHTTVIS